ncbi:hypothetical protein BLNAU_3321 [Blattamonas nauphoetae]|uniref:Uncharacterized protein n=1 Tax=Blattamonas nauphoetae TaxID=2049346 RepID=A0ABQ9YDT2_9EUKA|nr:hypothetical protein BLNAU_3321 [Blattamonas nauphoetae]
MKRKLGAEGEYCCRHWNKKGHPACAQYAHQSPGWIVHACKLADVGCFVQLARDHSALDLSADIACESEL